MFGYEDELACITDPLGGLVGGHGDGEEEEEEDGEESWGDWADDWGWRRRKKREIPSYRWDEAADFAINFDQFYPNIKNIIKSMEQGRLRRLSLGDLEGPQQYRA